MHKSLSINVWFFVSILVVWSTGTAAGANTQDVSAILQCLTGPGEIVQGTCRSYDLDEDSTVDLADWSLVERRLSAPLLSPVLFVTDSIEDELGKIDLALGTYITLIDDQNNPKDVGASCGGGHVFWIDQSDETVSSADFDGQNVTVVLNRSDGLSAPEGIFIDDQNGHLYVADWGSDRIIRSNLDGSSSAVVLDSADGLVSPEDVVVSHELGRIFWIDSLADKIASAGLDGSDMRDEILDLPSPQKLAIDPESSLLYWTDNSEDSVFSAQLVMPLGDTPTNRTDVVVVASEFSSPEGVAVDSLTGTVFVSDWLEDEVYSISAQDCAKVPLATMMDFSSPEGIAYCGTIGQDCNGTGVNDLLELSGNDCNVNSIPDDCESLGHDCDNSGLPDLCEYETDGCAQSCCDANENLFDPPGCIQSTDSCQHVLILPGRSGVGGEDDVAEMIIQSGATAQVWNWTEFEDVEDLLFDDRVFLNEPVLNAGDSLARAVRTWRNCNPGKSLNVLAADAGANVLWAAVEATDGDEHSIIASDSFDNVVFSTSVLDVDRSLARLDACTSGGIFNYYSSRATPLAGSYSCFFGFFQNPVHWAAAGRFGYRETSLQFPHITGQLGWIEDAPYELDNNGSQFDEFDEEFFQANMLTILLNDPAPAIWTTNVADEYEDGENPPVNMGEPQACFESMPFDPRGIAIDVGAGKVYWSDRLENKISRADLDGSNIEDVVTGNLSAPAGLALDLGAGKIYWVDENEDSVNRANLDGTDFEILLEGGPDICDPRSIALDTAAGKMYWTDPCEGTVQRANMDGSLMEVLLSRDDDLSNPQGIALHVAADQMFVTDNGNDAVYRASLSGADLQVIVETDLDSPQGIAVDTTAGRIFWTDWLDDTIKSAALDGSDVQVIVGEGSDLLSPQDVAVDEAGMRVYWTDDTANAIQRVDFDSSVVFNVLLGEDDAGCINDTSAEAHVIILPGILGTFLSSEDEGAEVIEEETGYSTQVWNWTAVPEANALSIFERLVVNDATKFAGLKLAYLIRDWRDAHPDTRLYIMGGSGGVMIMTQACEAKTPEGDFILADATFERMVFVSGAMSTSRSLANTYRCVRDGIFNYYSSHDETLVGVFCIFGFAADFGVPWPAVGRYGYREGNANLDFVAYQLGWREETQEDNDGRHLNLYQQDFFREYVLSVFELESPLSPEWTQEVHHSYRQ